ncbi:MAG: hypothetical protein QOF78_1769 [Phycisphaerales bacterium]|jgi:hypothetical protein|nr:hypothetical protein [Phycisphaerales bacterium]
MSACSGNKRMNLLTRLQSVARPWSSSAAGARRKREAEDAAGSADQRNAQRLPRQSSAQLLLYPSGRHPRPIDVQVVDYSSTGIGIIHNEGLLIGKKFVVREPHVTDGNTCLFTVVRSDQRSDGTYSIGLHVGNSLESEHAPLLAIPPAPGLSRRSKLLFAVFALLGSLTMVLVALFNQYG